LWYLLLLSSGTRPVIGVSWWLAKGSRRLEVLLLGGRLGFGPVFLLVNRHLL
jgi:hypothetical protein